ncbi:hypothetical protein BC941DRAFT_331896, partial [Chlamydoabsidia padenii]
AWSVVARGRMPTKRVPNVLARRDQFGNKERLEMKKIFEVEDIRQQMLARKATAILQNTLFSGAVLFEFKAEDFEHHTDAYMLVATAVGPIHGARPISKYGNQHRTDLIIEVQFKNKQDVEKAINIGFT